MTTNDEMPAVPYDTVETLVERDGFPVGSRGSVIEELAEDAVMVELEGDADLVLPTYDRTSFVSSSGIATNCWRVSLWTKARLTDHALALEPRQLVASRGKEPSNRVMGR